MRRFFAYLAAATLAATTVVAAAPQAVATVSWPVLSVGSHGPTVTAVQVLLGWRGYSLAPEDGDFGSGTATKVKSFQSAHGLTADGIVGENTWSALIGTLRTGSNNAGVKAAQVLLNKAGAGLVVDGDFGAATDSATKAFQSSSGITADGIIGPTTWRYLAAQTVPAMGASWARPLPTSSTGRIDYLSRHHDYPAVDIAPATGTPIYAVHSGTITARFVATSDPMNPRCGNGVDLTIASGVVVRYCHMISPYTGSGTVSAGARLGSVGNTGNSSAPHLHFGIMVNGVSRCPQQFVTSLLDGVTPPLPSRLPTTGCVGTGFVLA